MGHKTVWQSYLPWKCMHAPLVYSAVFGVIKRPLDKVSVLTSIKKVLLAMNTHAQMKIAEINVAVSFDMPIRLASDPHINFHYSRKGPNKRLQSNVNAHWCCWSIQPRQQRKVVTRLCGLHGQIAVRACACACALTALARRGLRIEP